MKTDTTIFKIVGRKTPNKLLSKENLGVIAAVNIANREIYEVQLKSENSYISLLTDKKSFDAAKNDKNLIVKTKGFWNNLADPGVKVFTEGGIKLTALKIF